MRGLFIAISALALAPAAPAYADREADSVYEALEAYALYQNDVSALLDLDVDSARAINGALARLARHDPARVSRGFMAYGALTAAQSPQFVAGVEARARRGEADLRRSLRGDVTYARREADGSAQAVGLILGSASADSARAAAAGARYDEIARSSTAAWITSADRGAVRLASVRLTPQMRERLRIGALDARPQRDADAFGGRRFWDALAGREGRAPRARGGREHRSYTDVTDRMLTLGALIAMGAADNERSRVRALLDEPLTRQCLVMQQLQLRQCLSVSVDASERTYCLGRHGLTGPGSCFSAMVR
jgi:hypothetical protein